MRAANLELLIITSLCIDKKLELLYCDRDFTPFTQNLGPKAAYTET